MLRNRAHALGGRAISCAMVAVLGVAAVLWIYETKPKHLAQLQPPSITLTAAERSAAEAIPPYSDAIPVVTYHTVSDREPSAYTVSLELENFTRQLAALRAAGFNSVKLGEFEDFVFGRPVALPSRPILITIDDGTATDYSTVDPILARYGYNAVAFLITGSIARPGKRSYYLSSDELDSLAGTGRWEFGGHTNRLHKFLPLPGRNSTTGPALDHLIRLPDGTPENHAGWRKRVSDDFTASQNYFEDQFGRTAFAFAYPFSAYGQSSNDPTVQQDLAAVLQEHGYRMAFIGEQEEPDRAVTAGDEPYHLQRFGIRATMTALDVLRHIKDSVPRPIPATLAVHDWVGTDADCAFTDAADTPSVRVTPTADFGRCRPELNNTRWTDYTFRTEVWGANRRTTAVISLRDAWPAPGGRAH